MTLENHLRRCAILLQYIRQCPRTPVCPQENLCPPIKIHISSRGTIELEIGTLFPAETNSYCTHLRNYTFQYTQ